jgi:hypothetical protein
MVEESRQALLEHCPAGQIRQVAHRERVLRGGPQRHVWVAPDVAFQPAIRISDRDTELIFDDVRALRFGVIQSLLLIGMGRCPGKHEGKQGGQKRDEQAAAALPGWKMRAVGCEP